MSKFPSYRRHKRSKQAVVTLYGRDFYLGKYGTEESREAYRMLIAEYLKGQGKTDDIPKEFLFNALRSRKGLTVVEAADRYLTYCNSRHRPVERIHIRNMLKIFVGLFENERADLIGPPQLREVRRVMVGKGWSRRYVNQQVDRIKRMYKWLVIEQLVPETVYRTLRLLPGLRRGEDNVRETSPVPPISDKAIEAILPHLPEVVADMVRLQRLTGMRPAELCMLRPCDVDRGGDVWIYQPETHKTEHHGKERKILIGPRAQEVLLRYLARDAQSYCFSPRDSEAKRRLPGRRSKGFVHKDKYDVTTYRRAIHRACDKAFPCPDEVIERAKWQEDHRWSPNQLRHSAATEIRREFGLEAAQLILGHTKADVTQIYAERDLTKGIEVARRLG